MIWLVAMLCLGPAQAGEAWSGTQVAEPTTAAPLPATPPTLEEVWSQMRPAELLTEAVARRSLGDFEGADARLAVLAANQPNDPAVAMLQGMSMEFQEKYQAAVDHYERAMALAQSDPLADEAAFRRALCLEDLGRHSESLQAVKALTARRGWTEADQTTLDLERGVTELRSGKAARGIRRIDKALRRVEGSEELPWMRAKARTALARHALSSAAQLPLQGNKKAARNLTKRAGLMGEAEQHVVAVAHLHEPEYALEGLLLLGDAYLALHDDMLAAPAPKGLDDEQVQMYRDALAERASVLRTKAFRYYDEGVTVAVRTRWQGHLAADLKARRDRVAP